MLIGGFFVFGEEETGQGRLTFRGQLKNCPVSRVDPSTSPCQGLTLLPPPFHSHGMQNFIVLTGHAGGAHRMALQDAGEELIAELPEIRMAVVTEYELAKDAGRDLVETAGDAHAGEIETSRIMHSHPHLVVGTGEREFPTFPMGILVRNKRKYWPNGVWGDPTKASVEKGEKLEALVVAKVVELALALEDFTE